MLDFYEEKRNLAQEILIKAGLEHIAERIDEIEEFNFVYASALSGSELNRQDDRKSVFQTGHIRSDKVNVTNGKHNSI